LSSSQAASSHCKSTVIVPSIGLSCGTAEVTIGKQVRAVHENESVYIPIGSVHRLANKGKIPLELIEVQTGSYLGEDDIERLEDVYKRTTT
jgi:mannose-6-phosphate isomerase-like protein (cupin superfamily)